MTDTPKVPETPNADDAIEEIVELVFETNYALTIAAFIAGALIIAGIVYYIGSRNDESEDATNAAD